MTRAICKPELWGLPKDFCPHPDNCCRSGRKLRPDLTPEELERFEKYGAIEFESAGATRKR